MKHLGVKSVSTQNQCMKALLLPLACGLMLLSVACNKEDEPAAECSSSQNPQSTSINKILPLGASRVQGARPVFESFRYELWKDLQDGGWTFDYIGTLEDPADYPEYADLTFDLDHEGRGGWRSGQILEGLDGWLEQTGPPDIVLFSSPGGNDALQGWPYEQVIENVNAIIDVLQADNPNVTIIIEQLAPGHSDIMTGELADYFANIQQDVVTISQQQTTATSQVIPVDMATGFTDDLLADDVHYNEDGAAFIAARYYDALVGVLEE